MLPNSTLNIKIAFMLVGIFFYQITIYVTRQTFSLEFAMSLND